jgi:signal transduction histidine kinase
MAPVPRWVSAALTSAALVVAVTAVIALLEPRAPALGLGVLYLLAVVPIALLYGAAMAGAVSVASMAAFNFFFLPPRHSLNPGTSEQWEVLLAFLVSSLVVGLLTARVQREARRSARLADEQAALRRVATLVARRVLPREVFEAVTREVGLLLGVDTTHMGRYEPDRTATGVAAWSSAGDHIPVGRRVDLEGESVAGLVLQTGRPARMHDYEDASGPGAAMGRVLGLRSSVGAPIVVDQRLWGVMIASSKTDGSLPPDTESRITAFTELLATAIADAESRADLARLAEEQAALRRVATLVAGGAPPEELFAAVTEEAGRLLGTDLAGMARYESDDTVTVLATWAAEDEHVGAHPLVPGPWPLEGGDLASMVWGTGRPVRIDDYHGVPGRTAAFVREELGVVSSVASPIVVEGQLWGVLFVHSKHSQQPFPQDTESRLTGFTELVATAIANAESRAGLARLAEEQTALRRVATLVARGALPEDLFAAVVEEVGQVLPVENMAMGMARFESDRTMTTVAISSGLRARFPVGGRWPLGGKNVSTIVAETGRSARLDDYADASGRLGVAMRERGLRSSVGAPIVVEGRVWGVLTATSTEQPLPADTESRLASFTKLVATAIANAENRADLIASRARIAAAADETRKRIERDLHDGTQQRLVSLALELHAARAAVPPQLTGLESELSHVADGLVSVSDEVREISRGIHPAILAEGGLGPALRVLCRRSAVSVELNMHGERRLPEQVEVTAYYVVSEALTNAAKHAHPSIVNIDFEARDTTLQLAIRDDGIGGADPSHGSGLVGLRDRVEAIGGTLQVTSPAGNGTTLVIDVPLEGQNGATSPAP